MWTDCQCFHFLETPESAAAFWADLLSHLKEGTSFASSDPPGGAGAAGAPQCLGLAWAGGRGGRPVHGLLELRLQTTLEIECLQRTRTSLCRLALSRVTMQFSNISGALGRSLHGLPPPDAGAARLDSFEDGCPHAFEI